MGRPPFDPSKYIGKKYGRLTLIEFDHSEYLDIRHRNHFFKCRCDCGTEKIINLKTIIGNKPSTISCGCYNKEINAARIKYLNYSHGLSNHRLHHIWDGMKSRCYKASNPAYSYYGARGIRVCDEWLHDFKTFYDWAITHGYADNLSIDRIDHEGNYCPKNCRFVNDKLQQSNRRDNVYLTYTDDYSSIGKGKLYYTYTLSDWARILRVPARFVSYCIKHRDRFTSIKTINGLIDYINAKGHKVEPGKTYFGFLIPTDGSVTPLPEKYEESLHD